MSAVRRAVRSVGRFIKKNWKKIVIAAAVVFTAGVAAAGLAAMKGAFATKGVLGGIGATMKAGAAAIGKVVTGQGFAAARTGAQAALGVSNTAAATAAGLGNTAGIGAGLQGGTAAATNAAATAATNTAATQALSLGSAAVQPTAAGISLAGGSTAAGAAGAGAANAAGNAVTQGLVQQGTQQAVRRGAISTFMQSPAGAALVQGGIGALSASMQSRAAQEEQPLAYWGRDARSGTGGLSPDQMRFDSRDLHGRNSSWQPSGGSQTARRLLMDPNDMQPEGG